ADAGPSGHGDGPARVGPALSEDRADRRGAVAEDPLELVADHEPVGQVAERAQPRLVLDVVADDRGPAVLDRLEPMGVLPAPVRTLRLDVDEAVRRIDVADLGDP